MSAAEVLAQHQFARGDMEDGCLTCGGDFNRDEMAAHQLDALKAAGHAFVEKSLLLEVAGVVGRWPTTAPPRRQREDLAIRLRAAADAAEADR